MFSGSAVVDKNNTSGFGTKANPPLVAIYTSAYNRTSRSRPSRWPTAPTAGTTFTKYAGNPVLDIGSGEFRDPKVFWYAPAKAWRMVVVKATEHKVSIYSSPNLKNWTHLSDFGPAGAVGGVWECPDLFPLAVDGNPRNIKWVMVVNLNPGGIAGGSGGQYFVGDFDGTTFTSDDPADLHPAHRHRVGGLRVGQLRAVDHDRDRVRRRSDRRQRARTRAGCPATSADRLANSFHGGDAGTGTLTSPEFTISSRLSQFPGRRRQPSTRRRHRVESHAARGTVFADFEGATWGTGWTRHR